ncbi:superoxide dismutase [Bacillus aquiflavi]|uniref:superoxide dismutase n=1 Tax=Bacillus aquiflavi TaxID=2672567 RepID=UPI001CA9B3E5|nr:superoxide dismutase [Bacillus aquiflavi]UAC47126.1 superoxide dismutase [Bacillus aquiflavi]
MNRFQEYVKDVFQYNEQMKSFLESEQVCKDEQIWKRLDVVTNILEEASGELTPNQLKNLQMKVDELHEEVENYFDDRHKFGYVWVKDRSVPVGKHTLPPLPYQYHALEPYINEEIMKLHHGKHHRSYVTGLNKAEKELEKTRKQNDFSLVKHWSRELAFHGSGHYLHTIFWGNMSPNGGGKPKGKLLNEIESYFGSFKEFKNHFTEAAKQVEGVGWALLVWSPRSRHLEVLQSERHMLLTQWDTIPILVLDVWEHAYYLQYKNNRGEYVENWWNIVNWKDVESRFEKASELKWKPY